MKEKINQIYHLAFTQTAKRTYLTTFGAGISAFLGFIFSIVVARSISPYDFGIFSVIMNFIIILFVICDVGLSSSVLRFLPQAIRDGRKEESFKIIKLAFLFTLGISGFLFLVLLLFASPLAQVLFTHKELFLPLAIVSFSLLGLTLSFLFTTILQGQQRFLFAVITDNSVLLVKVLATLLLLILGKLTLISVLIIFASTSFVGVLVGLIFIGPKFLFTRTDWAVGKSLLFFGVWVALARMANSVSGRIDTMMLIRYVDPEQVGFYAAAQRMTFVFLVLINGMTAVLSPKFSGLKTNQEALSLFKKSCLLIALLFIPIVVLYLLAPWVTVAIYGDAYVSSIYIFRWLLVSSFFFVTTSIPTLGILYYLGLSKFFALLSIIQLSAIFVGNLILIPVFGVIGPAVSLVFAYGLVFVLSLIVFLRKVSQK